jgi:hypothetical protein
MRRYNDPTIMTAELKSTSVVATAGNAAWVAHSKINAAVACA